MIEIDTAFLTNEERADACAFVRNSGYDPMWVRYRFEVRPAMGATLMFSFDHYVNENGRHKIEGDHAATEPFVIYASDSVGWFQHYLARTGRTIEDG